MKKRAADASIWHLTYLTLKCHPFMVATLYRIILISLANCMWLSVTAQPNPCVDTSSMTPLCIDACIVCDINGYTGINNEGVTGQAPPGFCTSNVHHMQWIAFMAGSTDLTLQVSVFDCETGAGLEVGIYFSDDCTNFQLVSNCDGNIAENTSQLFSNTVPLVVGQYYYFVMDGNMNDVCSYTINVVSGSTLVDPLPASGSVLGHFSTCTGVPQTYATPGVSGATQYYWTLDGAIIATGDSVTVIPDEPGMYQLCLYAYNVCNAAPPTCQLIQVANPAPVWFTADICEGDCLTWEDTLLCDAGTYEFHHILNNGCDSVVIVQVNLSPPSFTSLDVFICDGDTLYVGGLPFYDAGASQVILVNALGCDSTIQLDLQLVICQINAIAVVQDVACFGGSTGSMTVSVQDGSPPFSYQWENIADNNWSGGGNLSGVGLPVVIQGLPTGTYLITVSDNFGNQDIVIAEIGSSPPLTLELVTSDFQGFAVSCHQGADGSIQTYPAGGTPPYQYLWSNGATIPNLENVPSGDFSVTLTDLNGCVIESNVTLYAPMAFQATAEFYSPDCSGEQSGWIEITDITGGIPSYSFSLNGNMATSDTVFIHLNAGDYTLIAMDSNQCPDTLYGELETVEIPEISAGSDITIDLGTSEVLQVVSSVQPEAIEWSPASGLSCTDCPMPSAGPFVTVLYEVIVTSSSGCLDTDSVLVVVNRVSQVYAPNVFTPENDGINDYFTLFTGPSVSQLRSLKIFDRWGELIWEGSNLIPGMLQSGWDGNYRGKPCEQGVYAWIAEAELLDGFRQVLEGDITLLRN